MVYKAVFLLVLSYFVLSSALVIDKCDSTAQWTPSGKTSVDTINKKEGTGYVKTKKQKRYKRKINCLVFVLFICIIRSIKWGFSAASSIYLSGLSNADWGNYNAIQFWICISLLLPSS